MKKITELKLTPLDRKPQLVQHFVSLEGEGGTIGRSALYIRTGECSLRCNFCDTAYSVEGDGKHDIVDMTSDKYVDLLRKTYSIAQRQNITNLSITGGEPLLNLNYLRDLILTTKKAFPKITQIIFETNGTMLSEEQNAFKMIEQLGCLHPSMKFMLSISPKLSGKVSYSSIRTDDEILDIYKNVLNNYKGILDAHCDIQLKFVHSDELSKWNETLIEYALGMADPLTKNQILIMPFTPVDPLGRDKESWENSKDGAANYAMANFFRYSPRMHVDRKLD
jgi:organic radical activating enzyme